MPPSYAFVASRFGAVPTGQVDNDSRNPPRCCSGQKPLQLTTTGEKVLGGSLCGIHHLS